MKNDKRIMIRLPRELAEKLPKNKSAWLRLLIEKALGACPACGQKTKKETDSGK